MASRLEQVSQHLSNSHRRGLLTGEVAIITGDYPATLNWFTGSPFLGVGQIKLHPL